MAMRMVLNRFLALLAIIGLIAGAANVPANAVVQVFAAGYRIHERILRPAAVAVSSGPPA